MTDTYTGWAPWHPKYGFQDEFSPATWVSTDLDEIAQRVKWLNQDDKTNNRNGWRAVRITLALASPVPESPAFPSTPSGTEPSVPASSYCALCDLEHDLHEDAQGFHHVIKGERVLCPAPESSR